MTWPEAAFLYAIDLSLMCISVLGLPYSIFSPKGTIKESRIMYRAPSFDLIVGRPRASAFLTPVSLAKHHDQWELGV